MSMKLFFLQIDKLRLLCNFSPQNMENQSPNMETRDCKLSNDI